MLEFSQERTDFINFFGVDLKAFFKKSGGADCNSSRFPCDSTDSGKYSESKMSEAGSVYSTHSDVEYGDYVEGRGKDGAHALDGRLVQAVVGRQHLSVRSKQPNNKTICELNDTRPHLRCCCCVFMCCLDCQIHNFCSEMWHSHIYQGESGESSLPVVT